MTSRRRLRDFLAAQRFPRETTLRPLAPYATLAGLPALALPVPGGPAGLPASLQLIGPPGSEEQLLALGRRIETALAAG
jgi:amidase